MIEISPELSVVIPAYNEEKRLGRGLQRLQEYFEQEGVPPGGVEILVVDDGSTDGTVRVAREWLARIPYLRLLSNGQNRGKGYSVRHGMLEARGRVALFTDADLSSPIEESEKLLAAIQAGNDVAIGSRAMDRSLIFVHQSRLREIAGIIFNAFVRLFTGLRLQDTQCGFKAFVREPSRIIFEQQRIARFGFDPEILFLAKRHGLRTAEVPVRWAHDEATKVHVFRDSLLMFTDLLAIRWNAIAGRYPLSR
jgi:dolichyl-phosphate beta-glucosyltransferase